MSIFKSIPDSKDRLIKFVFWFFLLLILVIFLSNLVSSFFLVIDKPTLYGEYEPPVFFIGGTLYGFVFLFVCNLLKLSFTSIYNLFGSDPDKNNTSEGEN